MSYAISLALSRRLPALLAAFCIACCAPPAFAQSPLSRADREALAVLVLGPKPNAPKACVTVALAINAVAMYSRMTDATDQEVHAQLLKGADAQLLKDLREREFSAWQVEKNPARLAQMEVDACLSHAGVNAKLGDAAYTCFSMTGLAARAEALKVRSRPKEEALADARSTFRDQFKPEYMQQVIDDVYSGDVRTDGYMAHRRAFAGCMVNSLRDESPAREPAAPK